MSDNYPPPPPPPGGGYPAAPPPPPGYGYGPGGGMPISNKKALWSMILGILGLVCCGFFAGIPALILGRSAQREIDASGGMQTGRGMATAGFVLGIISCVLGVISVILFLTGAIHFNASTTTSP